MPIDKSDLLDDDDKPSLTIRDIFSAEIAAAKVVTGKVADVLENGKLALNSVNQQEEAKPIKVKAERSISLHSPDFDFPDTTKTILAKNAWHYQESKIASGGGGFHDQHIRQDMRSIVQEAAMILTTNLKVYDMLPHKNFVGVFPMEHQHQLVYITPDSHVPVGPESHAPSANTMKVQTTAITSESKKLQTFVTMELQQDLQAMHGDNVYDEMSTMLANEIAAEFNYDMLNKFRETTTTNNMVTSTVGVPTSTDVMVAMCECSADIAKQNNRVHGANWAIVSKEIAAILIKNRDLDTSGCEEGPIQSVIGHINGIKVYLDKMAENNEMIVGYKGDKILDGGLTFFPHTLVIDSEMVINPSTFQPSKAMHTRGAWFMPTELANNVRRVKFKTGKLANYTGGGNKDSGYYYCPYIPLSMIDEETKEELEDVVLPYGTEEIMTVASLFGKEKENE